MYCGELPGTGASLGKGKESVALLMAVGTYGDVSLLPFYAVTEVEAQRTGAGHAGDQSPDASDHFIVRQPSLKTILHGLRKLLFVQPLRTHSGSCRRCPVGVRGASL